MGSTNNGCSALAVLLAAVALVGCGGGSSPAAAPPEGAYQGTLSIGSTTLAAIDLLVLEDGSFWSLYGAPSGAALLVAGFTEGSYAAGRGTIASSDGLDFGTVPPIAETFSGAYTATSISGTSSLGGTLISVSGTKFPSSTYDYDAPASITTIAGAWNLSLTDGTMVSTTISPMGALSGLSPSGCTFSGSITPRPSGKNVFDVSLTAGPAPCTYPNLSAAGIGVARAAGTGQTQLIIAVINGGRTVGIAAFGQR